MRHRTRSLLVIATIAVLAALGTAGPAAAHISVLPSAAPPGQFLVYTVTVPNELGDQATVEVDLTLPAGFALDSAEQVAGWQTIVTKTPDGVPTQVAWQGGRIPVGTFARFSLQGRNPASGASLVWVAQQRYERTTVTWDGPESADHPAAVVKLTGTATTGTASDGGTAAAGSGSAGSDSASSDPGAAGLDRLARSRVALALVLAGAALLVALIPAGLAFSRRRLGVPDAERPAPEQPPGPAVEPATTPGTRPRGAGKAR